MNRAGDPGAMDDAGERPVSWPGAAEIRLEGPLDVPASVEIFRRNGDDLVDRWDGTHLVRTLPVEAGHVAYACTVDGSIEQPALRVDVEDEWYRGIVEAAVRASFVLPRADFGSLLSTDPAVARADALFPGVRPVLQHDLFIAIVRSISAQQVNLKWAATTRRRLAEAYGHRHEVAGHVVYSLDPTRLAAADPPDIRALQFTTRKSEYIVAIAQEIASGRLSLGAIADLPDDEVISRLISIRGIGLWTTEWVLARTLGRPRVVAGDLGVRKAVGIAYFEGAMPSEPEVRRATAHWGASAGVAQQLLLHALASRQLAAVGQKELRRTDS